MRTVRTIAIATLLCLGLSNSITAAENDPSPASLTRVVLSYCTGCHNDVTRTQFADLTLQHYDVARAAELAPTTEKMIAKLRAGMMPPPGMFGPPPPGMAPPMGRPPMMAPPPGYRMPPPMVGRPPFPMAAGGPRMPHPG